MTVCSIAECAKPRKAGKSLCSMHAARRWRYGDPNVAIKPRGSLGERLWAKVDKTADCWIWTAAVLKPEWPYGVIQRGGRGEGTLLAHRVTFELAYGPIPDGLLVLHHCDNPRCVRPEHLFLGTQEDNLRDSALKGRNALWDPASGQYVARATRGSAA
jgi:hypothetical protein